MVYDPDYVLPWWNCNQLSVYLSNTRLQSEKAMAPHSSTLAWKIPWMEEPGRLQSMGSRRVGLSWALHFHFSLSCTGEGNGNPLQCSCLGNPRDGWAWWAAIYGVAQSRTRLKRLSSSSSSSRLQYPQEQLFFSCYLFIQELVWHLLSKEQIWNK